MSVDTSEVELLFEGMKQIGETALEILKDDYLSEVAERVNRKTNTLANSIQATGGGSQWIVGTNLEYAPYPHEGTEPHWIEGNDYLYWPGAEHPVRRVHHPGYAGNPFFDDSLDVVEGRSDDYISQAITVLGLD